jgi:hypothetical protein
MVLQSYLPSAAHDMLCVAEVKARISQILERAETREESSGNDAVIDLLRSVRAELARNFAEPEAPAPRAGALLH